MNRRSLMYCRECGRSVFACKSTTTGYRHAPMREPDGQPDCAHKPPHRVTTIPL